MYIDNCICSHHVNYEGLKVDCKKRIGPLPTSSKALGLLKQTAFVQIYDKTLCILQDMMTYVLNFGRFQSLLSYLSYTNKLAHEKGVDLSASGAKVRYPMYVYSTNIQKETNI